MDDPKQFKYAEVKIPTQDGLEIKGWLHEKDLINKKTILFFHGNAGELSNRNYKLNEFSKMDVNFLIIAWRGFSDNECARVNIGIQLLTSVLRYSLGNAPL